MSLPLNLPLATMQTRWKSDIDPVLASPTNNINIIKDVSLITGITVVNHLLGRVMQGWFLTDIQGAATIYRPTSSPFNHLTLTLNSSADVVVSIGVF